MKKYLSFFLLFIFSFFLASTVLADTVNLVNPLVNIRTPQALIGRIINAVMGLIGSVALLMFIYGGFTWLVSGGNPEKVKKGKDILIWSAIGLVIIFSSYALVNFVISNIKS